MRVGIDVDDVVANLLPAWLDRYNHWNAQQQGKPVKAVTADDLTQWEFWKDLGCTQQEIWALLTPDIYESVEPIEGALEAVRAIVALGHKVTFVTSCNTEAAYDAKLAWLSRHGFLSLEGGWQVIGVGPWAKYQTKADVPVDWLIDDHVDNCESFNGYALLVTRPHNRNRMTKIKRVKGLDDAALLLKFLPPNVVEPLPPIAVNEGHRNYVEVAREMAGLPPITAASPLPTDKQARKDTPLGSGVLDYFPAALAEIARVSKAGNDQHNPGQPLHWARGKSMDHWDCVVRHGMERGTRDDDGQRHTAKMAWRALALLQEELEAEGAPMSRASKVV